MQKFTQFAICLLLLPCSVAAWSETDESAEQAAEQVIEPEIYRRDVKAPKIDAQDIEISAYAGILNIEDFGGNAAYGLRLAYHITEDFFLEAGYGSSEVEDDSFRQFGLNLFPSVEESVDYYDLAVGYNIFAGEFFWGENYAIPSYLYAVAGAGSLSLIDEDYFSVNFGFGVRALMTDSLSVHVDFRDRVFENDIIGDEKITHNLEFTFGVGWLF